MITKSNRIRLAAGLAALSTAAVPAVGAIAGTGHTGGRSGGRTHRQTAAAYRDFDSKTLARGVHLNRYVSAPHGRRVVSDVLTATLGTDGVSAGILSGAVTQTAPTMAWAKQSKAVAAVNGDYFDISASKAPNGTVIRGGRILKGTRSGQSVVGQGSDGRLRVGTVYLDSSVTIGKSRRQDVAFYNTVLSRRALPSSGFAVLDSEWGGAPLRIPGARGVQVIVVGRNHKVLSTSKKISGQRVPAGGMIVVATGKFAKLHVRKGTKVTDTVGVRTTAPSSFSWGLGYGLSLMKNSQVIHNWPNDSDPRDARTALGWKDGGRTMILVTVEAGKGSAGEEVNEIADELAAQGATDAILLDGGGSTTLVARNRGHLGQVGPVSTSRNVERPVPIGIGVFVTHHR